jgi:hypothetical protein
MEIENINFNLEKEDQDCLKSMKLVIEKINSINQKIDQNIDVNNNQELVLQLVSILPFITHNLPKSS